jgi:preprotein translocase subunit YajC
MKKEMPKDLEAWEKTREMGRTKYILFHGVLFWGVPMFAIMTFFVNNRPDRPLTQGMILVSALVWALGGALFGFLTWYINERRYQKHAEQRSEVVK